MKIKRDAIAAMSLAVKRESAVIAYSIISQAANFPPVFSLLTWKRPMTVP